METAAPATSALPTERSQRIVDAMRESVAARGAAGSTFDHVARAAGVSRGLLHYYFGTKEQLLVEVVKLDCDLRMAALDAALDGARSAEELLDRLVHSLEVLVRDEPTFYTLLFELFTLSRRNETIAAELAALGATKRARLAERLAAAEAEGVLSLGADAEAVAETLVALGDGLALRLLAEPDGDHRPALNAAMTAARALVRERAADA